MLDFATKVLSARGTNIFSVGQAGFIIKSASGELLAIDLYLSNCVERVEGNKGYKRLLPQILAPLDLSFDAVICTHPHLDHFDIDSVPEMVSNGAKLYCSINSDKLVNQTMMEYHKDSITYVKPGDSATIDDFNIHFVNCDHGTGAPDALGVVVEVDGKKIYEVGDSCLRLDYASEIKKKFGQIDVLISPINGTYGNMDSNDIIQLISLLQPKLTIPCHYGMFAFHGGNLKEFCDLTNHNQLSVLIMSQGEGYRL